MKLTYLADTFARVHPLWQSFILDNCAELLSNIDNELVKLSIEHTIYPPAAQILRALEQSPQDIKIVILGQDPYHGDGEANGLAFAVNNGIKTPPSLRNILKELQAEYNPILQTVDSGLLENWSKNGVILLNSTLTVIKDQANSLAHIGWQHFTDQIIAEISRQNNSCVFMLWGNFAISKTQFIDENKHLILKSAHPSPLSASRGFFGNNHFILANQYLQSKNKPPMIWLNGVI